MTSLPQTRPVPRWLHVLAVGAVAVAAVLIALGGVVTTIQAGMSDPGWPTYPWALLVTKWDPDRFDYFVEQSHRAAGYTVGCCVIVLAAGLWFTRKRGLLRWLGAAVLLCVVAQGVLGGMRVLLDESAGSALKAIHGCFAQVVFSLLTATAVLTAPRRSVEALDEKHARRCLRSGLALTALVFLQVVWGVILRHLHDGTAQQLHVLTAFAVVAAVVWFIKSAWETPAGRAAFGRITVVLMALVVIQLALGVEAWIGMGGGPLASELQPVTVSSGVVRTLHVVVGAGVLATSVVAAMQAYRAAAPASAEPESEPAPSAFVGGSHMKGTA
jgi:cytochrome c oxidase assembly protein subunit 15